MAFLVLFREFISGRQCFQAELRAISIQADFNGKPDE
jgi:hypothetical protein